jgi:NAD(P)H dehydrogenase (quinone)
MSEPILVTGAAGSLGSVGRKIVEQLCRDNVPVRAMVRKEDERSKSLRDLGAEIVCGDLTVADDVVRVLKGCRRAYFGMSVSPSYLEVSCLFAAAALEQKNMEVIVNISQMTVSEITLSTMTKSPQQKLHWLAEQTFNWSGLPVVHVRATVFLEHPFFSLMAAQSISRDGTLRLPLGNAHTSSVACADVPRVCAAILQKPGAHAGKIYELTGLRSQDLHAVAGEYETALGRPVRYVALPFDDWYQNELLPLALPEHVLHHLVEMAKLHASVASWKLFK